MENCQLIVLFLYSGTDCRDDYLEIYDGNSTESPKIGRFCGNHVPDITTSGNQMYILFASGLDSPPYANSGFHATVMMLTNGKYHIKKIQKYRHYAISKVRHLIPVNLSRSLHLTLVEPYIS